MTRKDHELIAAVLSQSRPMRHNLDKMSQWSFMVDRFADMLLETANDGFNRTTFLRAAGMEH